MTARMCAILILVAVFSLGLAVATIAQGTTPGWVQVNTDGFGDQQNDTISALASFDGQLYAGTFQDSYNGAQLWRTTGSSWTAVMTNGFGITRNVGIDHLLSFQGQLYAGTWADDINGGEVWRSPDGLGWTRVISQGFGDPTNGEVFRFAVFSDTLYASTWSYTGTHGAEVWRSGTGNNDDWTRVVANGFGDAHTQAIVSFEVFDGYLHAGTFNWNSVAITSTGGQVWRTNNGTTWTQVNTGGFGTVNHCAISALAAFKGHLYASTMTAFAGPGTGSQVWRCQVCDGSDWTKVVDNGFGNPNTRGSSALEVFDGQLYFTVGTYTTGMEVWRTADGTAWEQVGYAGLGDSNNRAPYWDNSVTVFNNRLYIGTSNHASGGEVWLYLPRLLYLPLVLKNLETVPPMVSSTYPSDGATDVSRGLMAVSITFNEPMQYRWSLSSSGGFSLSAETQVSYDVVAHTFTFTRTTTDSLPASTVIAFTINPEGYEPGFVDLCGNPAPTSMFSFTTGD